MNTCCSAEPVPSVHEVALPLLAGADWALRQAVLLNAAVEGRITELTDDLRAACEREHRVAETLQRSLLMPAPRLTWPGLSVDAFCEPVFPEALIGGDFYDCFVLDDARVALVVGDVCGKGLVAATRIPAVKFALRGFLWEHDSPAQAMACLNGLLCGNQRTPTWPVALALVVFDRRTGGVVCTRAGAEPPLLLRAGGGWEALAAGGMMLGVQGGETYPSTAVRLEEGDVLMMVTDGLTEARQKGRFLGYEGVADIAARALAAPGRSRRAETTAEVGHAVLREAHTFCGGSFHDDVCLLALQRRCLGSRD